MALLQEAGSPPGDVAHLVRYEDDVFWDHRLYDRSPQVVQLTDRVSVEWFRPIEPISELGERDIAVSGIGTIAAARIAPRGRTREAFVAVSMYARWIKTSPYNRQSLEGRCIGRVGAPDPVGPLRVRRPPRSVPAPHPCRRRPQHVFGAKGHELSLPERERSVWARFEALGLEFLGPQAPNGRQATTPPPDVPADTSNVPTHALKGQSPEAANRQLDYAFASRGFHEKVSVRALNSVEEWGSSDHCRLLIQVAVD